MDGSEYLKQVRPGFELYKTLGAKAMARVPADADFDVMLDDTSNSIAVLVQQLSGHLKSRYRDLLTTEGEKPDRDRDGEFTPQGPSSRGDLLKMWNDGFAVAFAAIDALAPGD